ncbi:hypothetical protein FHY13_000900 [Xanthomonas arboricola]|uniref:hypothetical protein n=1 Tax=Xanthomonas euroxanthea TaxID=2259622 RepID=UPI00180D90B7|nr:hypothetical protein [Xanthomonas euroxanthea]MBB3812594.1 hypothetical protein [Xanthomonas euroxanthea]
MQVRQQQQLLTCARILQADTTRKSVIGIGDHTYCVVAGQRNVIESVQMGEQGRIEPGQTKRGHDDLPEAEAQRDARVPALLAAFGHGST